MVLLEKTDWLKLFFNYELDSFQTIKKIFKNKQFFKGELIFKSEFLDRIIETNPNINRSDVYWQFKQIKLLKLIKELPKKKVWIDKRQVFKLLKKWEDDFKRNPV